MRPCRIVAIVAICYSSALVQAEFALITNAGDERGFDFFRLPNRLQVLLIADPDAERAAASLDVFIGAGEDPEGRNGLAHFLEHMVFLGTEKYPAPGEFKDFIAGHGGSHNAYTDLRHTNYYFDVDADYLSPALDRFAQFFISPRLSEAYVERERAVVHAEYTSKLTLDSRREHDVLREIVVPGHSLAKFSSGNNATLGKVDAATLRAEVLAFQQKYYSANIMALVVSGPQSLAELKRLVVEKFSAIVDRGTKLPEDVTGLFAPGFLPAEVHIRPQREQRKLSLLFPVPSARAFSAEKPLQYLGHFIGHEGRGSLLAVLKSAGLATALSAGSGIHWRGGEVFSINIHLTREGLRQIAMVRRLAFAYINLLRRQGVASWRYEELRRLAKMSFDYGERGDPIREVSRLARRLHETPAEAIYWRSFQWQKFDKNLIQQFLRLLNKDNVLAVVVAPDVLTDKVSAYYRAPYRVVPPELSLMSPSPPRQLKKLKKQLALPRANPFIADNFSVLNFSEDKAIPPRLIVDTVGQKGWFLNDEINDTPRGIVSAQFRLPVVAKSPLHFTALKIYVRMVRDSLSHDSYNAALAGLSYSLQATPTGIDIEFYGYDDALPELSDRLLKAMRKANRDARFRRRLADSYFRRVREDLLRIQRNRKFDKLYAQILRDIPALLYAPYWSSDDVEQALAEISQPQYLHIARELFSNGQFDALVFGNFSERQARKYFSHFARLVKATRRYDTTPGAVVKFAPATQTFARVLTARSDEHAAVWYVQGRDDSIEEWAKMLLLEQMIASPFYRALRTEQQLGYIVLATNYMVRDVPGLVALVQSPRFSPAEIDRRMREFFRAHREQVFHAFERDRRAVVSELSEPARDQSGWSDFYWRSIRDGDVEFSLNRRLIDAVKTIRKEQVVALFDELLLAGNIPLLFVASGKKIDPADFHHPIRLVEDYREFKGRMPVYEYP